MAALIDPTVVHDIVGLVNTLVVWLTPLMLAWVVRVSIKNDKNRREEAAQAVKATVEVSKKVEEVAKVAAESVEKVDKQNAVILDVANKTHTLVNSKYGLALREKNEETHGNLAKAIRIAKMSGLPADLEDVRLCEIKVKVSEAELADHEAKQHVVDVKEEKQQQQQQH